MSSFQVNMSRGATNLGPDAINQSNANAADFQSKMSDPDATGSNDMKYYLDLQKSMLKEQQAYQALSTVMKARYDSATTAIRNFK